MQETSAAIHYTDVWPFYAHARDSFVVLLMRANGTIIIVLFIRVTAEINRTLFL